MKYHVNHTSNRDTWRFTAKKGPEVIVCYHNNCLDGILAGGYMCQIELAAAQEDTFIYLLPITYDNSFPFDPAKHPNACVYFVDFCPTTEQLKELLSHRLSKVTVYDHHKTGLQYAKELTQQLEDIDTTTALKFTFDMGHSGAGLVVADNPTLGKFHMSANENKILQTAERFDLWKHQGYLKSNENYLASCFSSLRRDVSLDYIKARETTGYTERLQAYTEISHHLFSIFRSRSFSDLISRGKDETDRLNEAAAEVLAHENTVPYFVPNTDISFLPVKVPGELVATVVAQVHELWPNVSVIICYQERVDGLKLSARPGPKCRFDMSELMKQLDPNGGGHANAAGAFVKLQGLADLKHAVAAALTKLNEVANSSSLT